MHNFQHLSITEKKIKKIFRSKPQFLEINVVAAPKLIPYFPFSLMQAEYSCSN